MKKFGEGQQPFHAIIDIPEGDSQELTTVTDQALNSLYGELFNLLSNHGINPTATTNADLKQVARAVWAAVSAGTLFVDTGTANVKMLTHARGNAFLYRNGNSGDAGFTVEFLNKVENTGAVTVNVFDVENNQNHFNNVPLVDVNGNGFAAAALPANSMIKAYYDYNNNFFKVINIYNTRLNDGVVLNIDDKPLRNVALQYVESINDLANINKVQNRIVFVKSYFAGRNKGGGFFVYDEALKNSNDGGTIINGWRRLVTSELNVNMFGANGDGVADDTVAIQSAINASLNVCLPQGQYLTTGVKLRTGSKLNGSGADAVLIQKYDVNKYFGILQAQSANANIADNIKDITVTNLTLKGTVETHGFSEHVHLVHFDGVSNVLISNCKFIGFRGDGVYIGSGTSGDMERHNTNVTIKDNFFDGVNNQNRNGVSFIDVNGALVDNNTFVNTTKAGMPGAIDFEADFNPWHILEDITITNNKILDVKAGIASIQVYLPATCPYVPRKITIANNYIKGTVDVNGNDSTGSLGIYVNTNKTTDETITNHVINNNYVDTTHSPLHINGSNGGEVKGNTFVNSTQSAKVGFANRVKNVRISGNKFNKIGKADNGLVARNISFVDVDNNKFIDCGTYGYAMINLDNGASSYLTINNNYFYNAGGTVTNALWVNANHTLAPNTNKWFDNHYDNLGTNFKAEQSNQLYTAFTPKVFAMVGGTGTVAINNGSTNVVGTGTKFTTELLQGSQITVANQNLTVASIQSDTQLTTTTAAKNTYSGAAYQYNASGAITYSVQSGYYRLNGKKASYHLKVSVTASPSGTLRVTLPKLANTNNIELPQTITLYGITTTGTLVALINSGLAGLDGSSGLDIYTVSQAGALSAISTTQNFTVIASGEYSIA